MSDLLKKLWGRSPHELLTRTRHMFAKAAERAGLPGSVPAAPADLKFSESSRGVFAPWAAERERFVSTLEDRWPGHTAELAERADRIIGGRFDLMGYGGLDFGRPLPDWHLDAVSGKRSPRVHWSRIDEVSAAETGDKKVIWELNRHQYFVTLGQAYFLTRNERYAEVFAAHIADWIEQNPPKMGVNWLSSLELAFRSISWIRAWYLFDWSPAFGPTLRQQILRSLYLNARHIESFLSTYFSPNTHLTGEALGLVYLGTFLDAGRESERWKAKGHGILADWLPVHIREDGSYCEQASHYARYTADLYTDQWLLSEREGSQISKEHRERLSRLYDYLMHITGPDGRAPLFGDDDGGRSYPFDTRPVDDMRGTLALGAMLLGRGDLKRVAGEPGPELLWVAGLNGLEKFENITAVHPSETSKGFDKGGLFSARTSWEPGAHHLVAHCGPHGFLNGGHAHADALSFTFYACGRPIFIDSGTFVYTADAEARDRYRDSAAHNCLTVDGLPSSLPAGPFSWKSQANASLIEWDAEGAEARFCGSHDGFEHLGISYSRQIRFGQKPLLEIVDAIESDVERSFEINFILAPGAAAEAAGEEIYLSLGSEKEIRLRMTADTSGAGTMTNGHWEIEDINISPVYGREIASKRVIYKLHARGSVEIATKTELLARPSKAN